MKKLKCIECGLENIIKGENGCEFKRISQPEIKSYIHYDCADKHLHKIFKKK